MTARLGNLRFMSYLCVVKCRTMKKLFANLQKTCLYISKGLENILMFYSKIDPTMIDHDGHRTYV